MIRPATASRQNGVMAKGVLTLRDDLLRAVEVLARERTRLQLALRESESAWTALGEHVAAGGSLYRIAAIVNTDDINARVSEAHADWEAARHRAQQLLYRLSLVDGESVAEVGRQWGVSGQLVSRMIHESGYSSPR